MDEKVEKYSRAGRTDRRNHILNAAFEVFLEGGPQNMRMEEIARRAGFGKSTLYEYFSSKDDIITELVHIKMGDPYKSLRESIDPSLSPRDKLKVWLSGEIALLIRFSEDGNLLATIASHPEYFAAPPIIDITNRLNQERFQILSDYIQEGMESGDFSPGDPALIASIITGGLSSFLTTLSTLKFQGDAGQVPDMEAYTETFFALLEKALIAD
ncbi:MAG: TetR/AcrR family transcriptional regulator [Clostridiales Family XIII bacterium]|jgi:TetR/AcrR family fatty acid metabolism transcriptional regulator|nr:TetR/AcrR family transcriptional regulator [Clostridiales Family XIII bacterium]